MGSHRTCAPGILEPTGAEEGDRVEFVFDCGWCGGDNYFVGKQVGFWVDKWEIPSEWDCRFCDGLNYTPDPPWTEA